jgi:hypothetical protein
MDSRLIAGLAVGAVIAIAGCGGDDNGNGNGDGGGEDALACIQDAGLTVNEAPGDPAVDSTSTITVEVPPNNRIIVNTFGDEAAAEDYSEGQAAFLEGAGAGGSSEVVGSSVVGVARGGAEEELDTVKGCLD